MENMKKKKKGCVLLPLLFVCLSVLPAYILI